MRVNLLLAMVAVTLWSSGAATAQATFEVTGLGPSCARPLPNKSGRAFYVDPVAGSMEGDGSKARPWHTLAEVVDAGLISTTPRWDPVRRSMIMANPNAPIKPGDTIYLMSGNHGAVIIQGWNGVGNTLVGFDNSDFITVEALPGQTPVATRLTIKGGAKWIFRGLTFRSENTRNAADFSLGVYSLVALIGPHDNILFEGNRLESRTDTSQWTLQDWNQRPAAGFLDRGGRCIAMMDNIIRNVVYGLNTVASDGVVFRHNTIDHFTDDAIDYASNNLLIENNTITNSIENGDLVHRDAMQGQPFYKNPFAENITIKNNTVIRITDPNLAFPGSLQGIDAFDGTWSNVTVTGNTVITNAWHGISYYGTHHLTISNNIVVRDSGRAQPCYNVPLTECLTRSVMIVPKPRPWIGVFDSKDGTASSDVSITDNIAEGFQISARTAGVGMRRNACIPQGAPCSLALPVAGGVMYFRKPGVYDGNVVESRGPDHWFTRFDVEHATYDLTLKYDPRDFN